MQCWSRKWRQHPGILLTRTPDAAACLTFGQMHVPSTLEQPLSSLHYPSLSTAWLILWNNVRPLVDPQFTELCFVVRGLWGAIGQPQFDWSKFAEISLCRFLFLFFHLSWCRGNPSLSKEHNTAGDVLGPTGVGTGFHWRQGAVSWTDSAGPLRFRPVVAGRHSLYSSLRYSRHCLTNCSTVTNDEDVTENSASQGNLYHI